LSDEALRASSAPALNIHLQRRNRRLLQDVYLPALAHVLPAFVACARTGVMSIASDARTFELRSNGPALNPNLGRQTHALFGIVVDWGLGG